MGSGIINGGHMQSEAKKATKNTSMLYLMNIAKMVFPLLTLPYLTRVLTVDCYAIVTYVKAVMQYVQIFLIFGFTLSATKDIVNARGDKGKIGQITGGVLEAKGVLSAGSAAVILILTLFIPLLRENPLYTGLAFINIVITEMLADFLATYLCHCLYVQNLGRQFHQQGVRRSSGPVSPLAQVVILTEQGNDRLGFRQRILAYRRIIFLVKIRIHPG